MCETCKRVTAQILPTLFLTGADQLDAKAGTTPGITVEDTESEHKTADAVRLLGEMCEILNDRDTDSEEKNSLLEDRFVGDGRTTVTLTAAAKFAVYAAELSRSLARMLFVAIEEKAGKLDEEAVHFVLSDVADVIRDSRKEVEEVRVGPNIMAMFAGMATSDGEEEPAIEYRH